MPQSTHLAVTIKWSALLLQLLLVTPVAAEPHSLGAYESSIIRSCQTDADCTIKDVHNCCGYYPACVNREAKTDPDYVRRLCENEQMGGICGFPEISGCRCINKLCAEADGNSSQSNPVEQ